MKGWFFQSGDPSPKHQQAENEYASVQDHDLDGEEADSEVDGAPDDAEDGGVANGFAGANDEQGLVLGGIENGMVWHRRWS